jgi:hypothetical protein
MRSPSTKMSKVVVALAAPLAMVAASAVIWQASNSAFSATTRNSGNNWSTGTVALTDDDAGSARFQVTNMLPGQTDSKCIKVTADVSVAGVVKGYALNAVPSPAGLENRIMVTVDEGNGATFASCTGFTSTGTVIPLMSLATLAGFTNYANGAGSWAVSPGVQSRTYKITWTFDTSGLTQAQLDQLQGASTGVDFQWELQSN